ncbi:D-alanyl-D-alanine carboxypeptidase family protein [Companilactobacillus sp. DQM5]|uniref:D-alanyl-D-alanine carboxypeptidase family protein n=1 Tax=Companilactobacillus sp. DQM5 TaxID=3463359 RepID=UPI00405A0925
MIKKDNTSSKVNAPRQEVKKRKIKNSSKKNELNSPLLLVVNKKHPLPSDYNPYHGDVSGNNSNGTGLKPEVNEAKKKMITAMRQKGFPISDNVSGYRSYEYQKSLYDNYVQESGQQQADTFSARPGYSDHQTSLAFDLLGTNGQLPTDDNMYSWLQNNAYKYGFIIRFPRGETKSTGYIGEEWHIRYIGVKFATEMHDKKITTLEKLTHISGGDYNSNKNDDIQALSEQKKISN